jgi:predicted acetyltransferase
MLKKTSLVASSIPWREARTARAATKGARVKAKRYMATVSARRARGEATFGSQAIPLPPTGNCYSPAYLNPSLRGGSNLPIMDMTMALEIREAHPQELAEVALVTSLAFDAGPVSDTLLQLGVYEIFEPIGCWEDGRLVACLSVGPMAAAYEGVDVPLGAVSMVSCLPEERRRGLVGRLLVHALEHMRRRGLVLSGLFTPHPSLYRRYGWAVAHRQVRYIFHPKDLTPRWLQRPRGKAHRVQEEDWPLLDSIYGQWRKGRNGLLARSEAWWRRAVFGGLYYPRRRPREAVVWHGPDGRPTGYVVYDAEQRRLEREEVHLLTVRDMVALDGDAYAGLLRFLLSFDMARDVVLPGDALEPLLVAVDEAQRVEARIGVGMMLRIVDVPGALSLRPTTAPDGLSLLLAIRDASAPWNDGLWWVEAGGGRLHVLPGRGEPDLACDVAHLAPIYSGLLSVREAARTGLIEVKDERAMALAQRLLEARLPPGAPDPF